MVGCERERQNGSCPLDRGRSEAVKAVRSVLRSVACLPSRATVTSEPELFPRSVSVPMALKQP